MEQFFLWFSPGTYRWQTIIN